MALRYTRQKSLLKLAPWADLDLLREKLIEACEEIFVKWGDKAPATYRDRFDEFLTGHRGAIPNSYDFQVAFIKVLRTTYREYRDDMRWDEAKSELERYFFRATYWVN